MNRNRRGNQGKSRRKHQTAWAPYNFVPLQGENQVLRGELRRHDAYFEHSGYFEVQLTTESPTYIRGMLEVLEKESGSAAKDNPDFFSVDSVTPMIPGSSLRGMLRNLVEIISFGKVHFVSDKYLVYRSVFGRDSLARDYREMVTEELGRNYFMYPSQNLHAGYLVREASSESGWAIQPAQEYNNESFILVDKWAIEDVGLRVRPLQVTKIWVKPSARETYTNRRNLQLEVAQTKQISTSPQPGYVAANLVVAGNAPKRHWYTAIYEVDEEQESIPISKRVWNSFITDHELQRGIPNRSVLDVEGGKTKLLPDNEVFYIMEEGKLRFLGPTMFFRVPYKNSVVEMIPSALRHKDMVDYAEAMFGYVSEDRDKRSPTAYAGRVSVTSAQISEGQHNLYLDTIPLKILGSPKPTTFQHYLEQVEGADTAEDLLFHYNDNTTIRGHKLYWRQEVNSIDDIQEDRDVDIHEDKQHTRVTPLRPGVEFTFKVHFDNLSSQELGALAWALTLGDDAEARHQIGMGKPFGMGIVKLESHLVLIDRKERYKQLFTNEGNWEIGKKPETDFSSFVQSFKDAVKNAIGLPFDQHERIQEMKILLRKRDERFSYMSIDTKDYDGRPVLPRPSEIVDN